MLMKKLHNPTENNILNYPIEEADFDHMGIIKRNNQGAYIRTGNTLTWSLPAGATLEFPEYVADYLLSIYGFLQIVGETVVEAPVVKESEGEATTVPPTPETPAMLVCKGCGQSYPSAKGIALHMAGKHPELFL
jgi:hypothetical protein